MNLRFIGGGIVGGNLFCGRYLMDVDWFNGYGFSYRDLLDED